MTIRDATDADIPALLHLGRRFFAVSGYASLAPYDPPSVAETLRGLIAGASGILLVAEADRGIAGAAGGLVYPFHFARSQLTGQELFWWIEPEHRGRLGPRLLERMEQAARGKGARSFVMGALAAYRPERTGAFYRRRGYAPMEHLYIREL